jgi:hypothetical protein
VASPADLRIRLLEPSDDRSALRSGDIDLDRFFHRFAGQNPFRHRIGATYIAVGGERIRGFVTVSPGEMAASSIKQATRAKLPGYPLPILRLSRLAVDERRAKGLAASSCGRPSVSRSICGIVSGAPASSSMRNPRRWAFTSNWGF